MYQRMKQHTHTQSQPKILTSDSFGLSQPQSLHGRLGAWCEVWKLFSGHSFVPWLTEVLKHVKNMNHINCKGFQCLTFSHWWLFERKPGFGTTFFLEKPIETQWPSSIWRWSGHFVMTMRKQSGCCKSYSAEIFNDTHTVPDVCEKMSYTSNKEGKLVSEFLWTLQMSWWSIMMKCHAFFFIFRSFRNTSFTWNLPLFH